VNYKKMLILVCCLGLAIGFIGNGIGVFQNVNADSKYDTIVDGVPYVGGVPVDYKTGVPITETILIDKDNPLAKERTVTLRNGVNNEIVAQISWEEFLNNQEYYNKLLDEVTKKALQNSNND
jgi:hypothetical protein